MGDTTKDNSVALKALFNCLLESVSEEGHWRDFDESWGPIITTISCELLLDAGVKIHDKWYIHREQYKPVSLHKSIEYLNSEIREDGTFGTDLWDSLRLGKVIVANELKTYFSNYDKLHSRIIESLRTDDFITSKSEWRGSGFYACAVDYLDLVNMHELSANVLEKLLYAQESDGCWTGAKSKEGQPLVSPVWHTAQAILTLRRKDTGKYRTQIERALNWLVGKQEEEGSWPSLRQFEIYFTAYAVLALHGLSYEAEISRAVGYLESKIDKDGKCSDLGGTLMCALVFWELSKDNLNHTVSFMDYILSLNNSSITNSLELQIRVLNDRLETKEDKIRVYEAKYKDADIVISKKQLLVVILISLFITTLGTVAGIYGLKLALSCIQNTSAQTEQKDLQRPQERNNQGGPVK